MVRTRADNSCRKAVAAKAPRKQVGSSGAGCSSSSSKTGSVKKTGYSGGGGGNPLRICPTPPWQKGIAEFYQKMTKNGSDNSAKNQNGSSKEKLINESENVDGCGSSTDVMEHQDEASNGNDVDCQMAENSANATSTSSCTESGHFRDQILEEQVEVDDGSEDARNDLPSNNDCDKVLVSKKDSCSEMTASNAENDDTDAAMAEEMASVESTENGEESVAAGFEGTKQKETNKPEKGDAVLDNDDHNGISDGITS